MASFQSQFYDPATAPVIDRAGGFVVSGDRFNGVMLPGDEPDRRRARGVPAAGGPAAAVSRRAERLLRDAEGRLPASARDGLRHQRADDVPGWRRPVPESRADQHDGGLRLQRAAVGDADGDQRQSSTRPAAPRRATSRSSARCSRPTSPTRRRGRGTRRSIASCRGRCAGRVSYVGRSASHLERARNINQLQPGTIQRNPGVNTNALRPYLGFGSITLYETTGTSQIQQPADAGRAARRRAASDSASPTRSRGRRTTAAAAATSCRTRTTTAATTASRISIARTCWSRRCATASRRSSRRRRRCAGCSATGTCRASSRRSRARRSTFARPTGVDVAGVGPGSGNQFYDQVGDPMAVRTDWDPALVARRRGSTATPSAFPRPARSRRRRRRTRCGSRGSGTSTCRSERASSFRHSQRFDLRFEAFNILNRTRLGNAVTNPTPAGLRLHHVTRRQPDDADRDAVHRSDRAHGQSRIDVTTPAPDSWGASVTALSHTDMSGSDCLAPHSEFRTLAALFARHFGMRKTQIREAGYAIVLVERVIGDSVRGDASSRW